MGLNLEFITDVHIITDNSRPFLYEANYIFILNSVVQVLPDHDLADWNGL